MRIQQQEKNAIKNFEGNLNTEEGRNKKSPSGDGSQTQGGPVIN